MKKIIIGIVAGVTVIAGVIIFVVMQNSGENQEEIQPQNSMEEESEGSQVQIEEERVDRFPGDKDRDGISDEDEEEMGLNPGEYDTDGDGLSDKNEIEVWGTDPNNPDTDGDGFADGYEVIKGFNPNGEGNI